MQAIGYKELTAAVRGETDMLEAVRLIQQRSRNYAKRQLTWFRRNRELHWLVRRPGQTDAEILAQARQLLQENDR